MRWVVCQFVPGFMVESVLLIFLVLFAMLYYIYLYPEFRVKISVTISTLKRCSVRLYFQLFYLHYLCLFVYSGVQHILLCVFVFVLFVFVLCLVYPMLLVTLDCPFVTAPLVFSSVYSSQFWPGWPFINLWHIMLILFYLFSLAVLLKPDWTL
jgi:hypothetical protein